MKVARSIAELEEARRELFADVPQTCVSLVPTMGALHRGHRSLVELAHTISDAVLVSIFVNPLQFGPAEDYARYPRPVANDLAVCQAAGVDVVFVPMVADLYPTGRSVTVSAGPIGEVFEGASRPGHFDGVLTVVLKLLHLAAPDVAIFGHKDLQQLACIRRMVADLNVDVDIVGAPIVREPDGLALSSRNRYLSPADRVRARALSAALRAGQQASSPVSALEAAEKVLVEAAAGGLDVDYLALVDPWTMAEIGPDHEGPASMIIAARVGDTRLIDNAAVEFRP